MDFFDRLCRACAIPDVVRNENRLHAVASKLARQCDIALPDGEDARAKRFAAVESVVVAVVEAADEGVLDPLFADYADDRDLAADIARKPPDAVMDQLQPEVTQTLAQAVVDILVQHVRENPFDDRERVISAIEALVYPAPPAQPEP